MLEFITNNAEETIELGKRIGQSLQSKDVLLLKGDLGFGKTTLTKGVAIGLDIHENISSPTFTIVKNYSGRLNLNHIDAYRLIGDDESIFEMVYSDDVSIIEWPDNLNLPLADYIEIEISYIMDNRRKFTIRFYNNNNEYERLI